MERGLLRNYYGHLWEQMGNCHVSWCSIFSTGHLGFNDNIFEYVVWSISINNWLLMLIKFQVVELDFHYPSEGIHRRWDYGYRITATAATCDQAAFVLSVPKRRHTEDDSTQETLRTSTFPSTHVKVNFYILLLRSSFFFFLRIFYTVALIKLFGSDLLKSFWMLTEWCDLQEKWTRNLYIASVCYGRTVSWSANVV